MPCNKKDVQPTLVVPLALTSRATECYIFCPVSDFFVTCLPVYSQCIQKIYKCLLTNPVQKVCCNNGICTSNRHTKCPKTKHSYVWSYCSYFTDLVSIRCLRLQYVTMFSRSLTLIAYWFTLLFVYIQKLNCMCVHTFVLLLSKSCAGCVIGLCWEIQWQSQSQLENQKQWTLLSKVMDKLSEKDGNQTGVIKKKSQNLAWCPPNTQG